MIQLENVSVRYEDTVALHPVSLGIHEGQFTVLLGSSGAGKSTFLRCLNRCIPELAVGCVFPVSMETGTEKRCRNFVVKQG